jgi:hypothetical protein
MTTFFRGVLIGVVIEASIAVGLYQVIARLSSSYIDSSPFLVEYPLIMCVVIAIYLAITKRSYKVTAGMFAGVVVLILALATLLSVKGGA